MSNYSPEIMEEIIKGLSKPQKELPCKYFYDEKGSSLFDEICELEEYYPTRTEMKIMSDNIGEIISTLGSDILLIELGSGSSLKTKLLLENLKSPADYIPIDISAEHLQKSAEGLRKEFRGIDIFPLVADYTKPLKLPEINKKYSRKVVYYPGSTIGNFKPSEAKKFITRIANLCGDKGSLLIGVDLKKNSKTLEDAYNDKKGVTAEFNLNILNHLNRLIKTDFKTDNFEHRAFYNSDEGRIEMHLISLAEQNIKLNGATVKLAKDENILTEYSYKFSLDDFEELVSDNFTVDKIWTDENDLFSVQYLMKK